MSSELRKAAERFNRTANPGNVDIADRNLLAAWAAELLAAPSASIEQRAAAAAETWLGPPEDCSFSHDYWKGMRDSLAKNIRAAFADLEPPSDDGALELRKAADAVRCGAESIGDPVYMLVPHQLLKNLSSALGIDLKRTEGQ